MKLSFSEKKYILKTFPRIELSYEKKIYKKFQSADIYLTIPKGKKFFLWFRFYKGKPCCIFLELSNTKKSISNIYIFNVSFKSILCSGKYGTICFGTIFYYKNSRFFNTENIFYYKNKSIENKNQNFKLNKLLQLFKNNIKQIGFTNNDIILGMPIIETNKEKIISIAETLPYQLYSIQHRNLVKNTPFFNEQIKQRYEMTFTVKPDVKTEIYYCYYNENNNLKQHNVLYINDYKTSIFMNRLFRRIIENENIDNIEESEDEDDFENISDDKFVYLDKQYTIECVYCEKYKLWKPLKLADQNKEICTRNQLMSIEKNYI